MSLNISTYGQGKPLVFFHGFGCSGPIFSTLVSRLSKDYTLYFVDLPGFGKSPILEWAAFKNTLLAQLPLEFTLIGWSMGGLYATRLAVEEPGRLTHLVNIASSPRFIQDEAWPGIERTAFDAFATSVKANAKLALSQFMQRMVPTWEDLSSIVGDCPPSEAGLVSGLEALLYWDLREKMVRLTLPVCYMFGRFDTIVPRSTLVQMQTNYPQFEYVFFSKAAHAPFLSHQDQFVSALHDFLHPPLPRGNRR